MIYPIIKYKKELYIHLLCYENKNTIYGEVRIRIFCFGLSKASFIYIHNSKKQHRKWMRLHILRDDDGSPIKIST